MAENHYIDVLIDFKLKKMFRKNKNIKFLINFMNSAFPVKKMWNSLTARPILRFGEDKNIIFDVIYNSEVKEEFIIKMK